MSKMQKIRQRFSLNHHQLQLTSADMSQNTNQKDTDTRNKPKPQKRKSLIDLANFHKSHTFPHSSSSNNDNAVRHSYTQTQQRSRSIDKGTTHVHTHSQINEYGHKLFEMIHQRTNSKSKSKSHSRYKSDSGQLTLDLHDLPLRSSPQSSPNLQRAKSNIDNRLNPNQKPKTPTGSSPPGSFVEHEKNTLITQMKQLQSTMVQLGDMLRNQDDQLNVERIENKKLVEQVNNLADENMNLRQKLCQIRRERNNLWKDLQEVKLAEQSRRQKIIFLTSQLAKLGDQKKELTTYSESLIEQLAVERERSHKLKMKIKKYNKNVKYLHKRTKSIGDLNANNKYKRRTKPRAGTLAMAPLTNHSSEPAEHLSADMDHPRYIMVDLEGLQSRGSSYASSLDDGMPNASPQMGSEYSQDEDHYLTQKREELKKLEADTLEIIEQLEQETKRLLGDAESLTNRTDSFRRSKKRSKHRSRHKKKSKQKKYNNNNKNDNNNEKQNKRGLKRIHNDTASRRSIEDVIIQDDPFFVASKVTTKTTTETTMKTTIVDDAITTEKKETKVKTKFTYNTPPPKRVDITDEMDAEWVSEDMDNSDENDTKECDDVNSPNAKENASNSSDACTTPPNEKGESYLSQQMSILSDASDDMEMDGPDLTVERKAEVEMLKKVDAPVSMLLSAFEKQMQLEMSDDDSETNNDNNNNNEVNDKSCGSSLFAGFNGFPDSDGDDNDDDISSLWD